MFRNLVLARVAGVCLSIELRSANPSDKNNDLDNTNDLDNNNSADGGGGADSGGAHDAGRAHAAGAERSRHHGRVSGRQDQDEGYLSKRESDVT